MAQCNINGRPDLVVTKGENPIKLWPARTSHQRQIILIVGKDHHTVFYRVQCALFYIENDAGIFPAHFTWKVAEKWFKMALMMNKYAMINSCKIILEIFFLQKSL